MTLEEIRRVRAVLATKENEELVDDEMHDQYLTHPNLRHELVINLTNLALTNAGEPQYDPTLMSSVRTRVMGVILYALELEYQLSEQALATELVRFEPEHLPEVEKVKPPYFVVWRSRQAICSPCTSSS